MCSILTKGSGCRQKIEIFVDLHRAGHDKSVKKGVLAQIFTKLRPIDLRICFSCLLKSHLLRNLLLKFTFKNYEIKLNYQILKVGIPLEILAGLP